MLNTDQEISEFLQQLDPKRGSVARFFSNTLAYIVKISLALLTALIIEKEYFQRFNGAVIEKRFAKEKEQLSRGKRLLYFQTSAEYLAELKQSEAPIEVMKLTAPTKSKKKKKTKAK